ncbi:Ca-activated chloride channel family protein [Actinocorallia herbida]|uniref:Ca-activated chloride channel family protein n=1 Tax=Actinocorallia herbida TaxID=58109 RepID=A0A3N1CVL9_9ACTN|nr:VWA domain-containing protein [Actinocorallia herbida]ROO85337.1 Ca-activated chloride channel family protein [Actinocorallia herbida]
MITARRWAAGLLGALIAVATPGAAVADETPAKEPPRVELVLDSSGSMRAADIEGRTRMSVAKQAFNDVVDALPAETNLGIRLLGAQHRFPGSPKSVGCKDTNLLFPVGVVDKVEAKTAIATLAPTGWTPIGRALRAAAKDLGTGETTRRIVLITDGEDSCGLPDPCDVARELAAQGTHLVIDTLGLSLDAKVRQQLSCIAEATGGTYTAITGQAQLTDRLNQLIDRAEATYQEAPLHVAGTEGCATAPVLGPGVYSDREEIGEHRWYRVRLAPGRELRASVSLSLDRRLNRDYGVLLRATASGGRELVRGSDAGSGRTDVQSAGLRWSDGRSADDEDAEPRTVCLVVSNSFAAPSGVRTSPGMPLELTVDLVAASPDPGEPVLGKGWALLGVLALAGLVAGLLLGWLARWRISIWREK